MGQRGVEDYSSLSSLTESLKRSFIYKISVLWNSLTVEAIIATSVAIFKNPDSSNSISHKKKKKLK
jgi:hypothetical protein